MGVWSAAFLHQFQDGNPANFNAVPGQLSVQPGGLAVQPTPPPDQRGFPIRPGQLLDYAFTRAFDEVVGVDIALDIFFPEGSENEQLSGRVMLAGDQVQLFSDFVSGVARLQLFVRGNGRRGTLPSRRAVVRGAGVLTRCHPGRGERSGGSPASGARCADAADLSLRSG